jgi:4'-phosphopantetheinyl transferase
VEIAADEVHVWCASTRSEQALVSIYEGLLAPEEERRYRAYKVASARRQFLITRALVRSALSAHGTLLPQDWRFRTNAHGRPEIEGECELRFNASNAEELVVCAVTRGADVGIDVEPRRRSATLSGLASRVFSADEQEAIAALPEAARDDRALTLWTVKESYLKARGVGLSVDPRSISLCVRGSEITLERDSSVEQAGAWSFALLDIDEHRVAIARRGDAFRCRLRRVVPLAADGTPPSPPGGEGGMGG